MTTRRIVVLAAVIVCLAGLGFAQDEELPLKNWSSPPFWNPAVHPRAEADRSGGMLAHAQGMQAESESLPSSPLPFVAIAPCRIVDTRVAISDGFHQPNFIDDESRTFPFPSSTDCPGLPATAGAWSVNIQFRPMSQLAYLTAYPTGTTMPTVSTLTAGPSAWVGNAAIVPAGTAGAIDIYCQYAGRVIIDVNGYYSAVGARFGINRADRLSWLTVKGGEPATLSGTVTVFNGETGVIGVGTSFLSQVGIGDRVTVNSETRTVLAIADDTHLTVDAVWTANSTGAAITDAGGLFRLDDSSDAARVVVSDQGRVGVGVLDPQQALSIGGTLGLASGGGETVLQASASQVGTITYTLPQVGTDGLLRNTSGALTWDPASLLSGSGSEGQVAFWSGATSLSGSNNLYWDNANGRLGLGTTAPGQQLQLTGSLALPVTTASAGQIRLGGSSFLHAYARPGTNGYNTFVGQNAGNFTMGGTSVQGSYNTASGYASLHLNTTGAYNTASGYLSLNSNTTGVANTAGGQSSLHANTTGHGNTATGSYSLNNNTTGSDNTSSGNVAGATNTTGSYNTFLGAHSDASADNLTNATAIGSYAIVNASNKVRIGDSTVTVIEGHVAWSYPSDARLKDDIRDLGLGLAFVMQLRPVSFTVKGGDGRTDMGFLAQDLETLLGDGYSVLAIGQDEQRTLSLRGTDLIAPLVKAVQEQQATIKAQHAALAELRGTIAQQHAEIAALRAEVATTQAVTARLDTLARQVQTLLAAGGGSKPVEAIGN
jgi:hypothetical protein